MKTYKYICMSTAANERYADLEKWYTSQHFHDLLNYNPGIVGVQAFKCAAPQFRDADRPMPYVVIWDIEAQTKEDADKVFEVMRENGANGTTVFSDAFGEWWDMNVEPISDYVTREAATGKSVDEVYALSNTDKYRA